MIEIGASHAGPWHQRKRVDEVTDCPKGPTLAKPSIDPNVESYRKEVAELLDDTIAHVARSEYRRLFQKHARDKCRGKMCEALDALLGLGQGTPPDYTDEWVTLGYLTWYQPRQINLVASICAHHPHLSPSSGRLLVVDVGCGVFATAIGMAIGFAMRDVDVPIMIHGIDPSDTMKRTGKKLLLALKKAIPGRSAILSDLRRILCTTSIKCDFTTLYDYLTFPHLPSFSSYDATWLTVIHAAYDCIESDYNATTLRCHVNLLEKEANPQHKIVTGIDAEAVKRVAGRKRATPRDITNCILLKEWCPRITSLRKCIADDLELDDKRLLYKRVTWDPSPSKAKICIFVDDMPYEIDPTTI